MQILLKSDIEAVLTEHARTRGVHPETLALRVLRKYFFPSTTGGDMKEKKETLADYLGEHIGVIASSEHLPDKSSLSEDCGKKFAKSLSEKRGQGKL